MTLVFREVPAQVCSSFGEDYVDEEITSRLLKTAEESLSSGIMVDIRQYINEEVRDGLYSVYRKNP